MSEQQVPELIVERLKANLRAAGITLGDNDIAGMVERGFMRTVLAVEEIGERWATDYVPDYLKVWSPLDQAAIAPSNSPSGSSSASSVPTEAKNSDRKSILEIAALLRDRKVSPVELTEQSLKRIEERDSELNAFQLVLAEEARAAARQAEQEIMAGDYRGPLHGVPVAVKDLLAMESTRTTAGSKILADWVTDFNATGVEKLLAAGAVIVGKTRMSEFAYSPGSNNAHYGPTRNPWNLEHDTGGSSSGSGAAVADGMVYAALGSDTGGSIRIPASFCGLVGLKPTFGRVSLHGAVTLSWSLDHLGPLTNTVVDAALLLEILAGYDPNDPRTRPAGDQSTNFSANLEGGVKGLRIGVLGSDGSGNPLSTPEALAAWRAGLKALAEAGAELIEIDLPELVDLWMVNGAIIGMEAAAYHQPMLRERLLDFGEFMRTRVLSAYAYSSTTFVRAQQVRIAIRRRFESVLQQQRIDLLSTPSMPYPAPALGTPALTNLTGPFNALGWPTITVPVGLTANENLPLGLQLSGKPWDEATVLRAARALEANYNWQQKF
jgi:aspartyl-tRNA(Asn)/glutamyl-tRNA(Gln) amidotransferase subunit A